jgi:hypothetical protein
MLMLMLIALGCANAVLLVRLWRRQRAQRKLLRAQWELISPRFPRPRRRP